MKWNVKLSVIENYAETVQRTVTLLQTQKELIRSVIYWILSQVNKQVRVKFKPKSLSNAKLTQTQNNRKKASVHRKERSFWWWSRNDESLKFKKLRRGLFLSFRYLLPLDRKLNYHLKVNISESYKLASWPCESWYKNLWKPLKNFRFRETYQRFSSSVRHFAL